jgi:hypothetical protein
MGTRWSFALDKGRFLTSTQGSPEGSWGTFAVKTDGFGTGKSSLPASTCSSLTSRPCTAAYQRRQSTVTGGSCSSGGHGRLMLATARDHRISCKGKRKVTYGVSISKPAFCTLSRLLGLYVSGDCLLCSSFVPANPSRQANTATWVRSARWSLLRIFPTWLLTVFSLMTRLRAISLLG